MIRTPGSTKKLPDGTMVRLYGYCESVDNGQARLKYKDAVQVIDCTTAASHVDPLHEGMLYCAFGVKDKDTVIASTVRNVKYPIQWPILEGFIDLVNKKLKLN